MTMSASPIAVAAPPMSFFISPIEAGGLMSSPPVSKQTPLPTSVTFGASARPQVRSSSRGGSDAAAPTASIIGRFAARSAAAPRVTRATAPCRAGERHEGRLERLGPHVAGRRVDQRLRQRRARRRSARPGPRRRPAGRPARRRGRLALAVALEAVLAEEPAERLEPGVDLDRPGLEPVAAGRQLARPRPRAGSGRAPAPRACPSRRGPRRSRAVRRRAGRATSPSPASKPIARTHSRVGGRPALSRQRVSPSGVTRYSGIARGSGAVISGNLHVLRIRACDSIRPQRAVTKPIDRRRG